MKYEIQPCSPKASDKIVWQTCDTCNGCGWDNPAIAIDRCGMCQGSGRWSGVNVGIEAAPDEGYPFLAMLPGQCFIVPFGQVVEKTIRNRVAVQNKKDERKYCVVKHTEFECYEIVRVK